MKTANDNFMMVFCEGFAKFLENENRLLFDRMAGKILNSPRILAPVALKTLRALPLSNEGLFMTSGLLLEGTQCKDWLLNLPR